MPAPAKKAAKKRVEVDSSDESADSDDDRIQKGKKGKKGKAEPAPAPTKKTQPASKDQIQMIGVIRKEDMVFVATLFQENKKFAAKEKKAVKEAVGACVEAIKKPRAGQKYSSEGKDFSVNFVVDKGAGCLFVIGTCARENHSYKNITRSD